jgi:hypothetical protein
MEGALISRKKKFCYVLMEDKELRPDRQKPSQFSAICWRMLNTIISTFHLANGIIVLSKFINIFPEMFRLDPKVAINRFQPPKSIYLDSSCNQFTIMRNILWRSVGLVLLIYSTKLTFLTDLLYVREAESVTVG